MSATPQPLIEVLGREIGAAANLPDVRERFAAMASEAVGRTPRDFAAEMEALVPRLDALYRLVEPAKR